MNKVYVYKITNNINGKIYIGKSNNPTKRWKRHIYDARNYKTGKKQLYFHRAINKYGADNFLVEILLECSNDGEALLQEINLISYYNSNNINIGYNCTSGGQGVCGYIRTEEDKKAISIRNSGTNNGMFGYVEPFEERKVRGLKISATKQQNKQDKRVVSQETIQKLKIAVKNKKSQQLTESQKDKIIELYNTQNFVKRQIAEMFSIDINTVIHILRYWEEVKNNKLKKLNQSQKDNIIKLYLLQQYTKKQIAEMSNIPLNKIESVIKMYKNKLNKAVY